MSLDHSDLLKHELDQHHQYARHAFDRHLQWAALLCTLNGVAAGWLASRIEFQLDIFADVVFIAINAHAIYISTRMLNAIEAHSHRIHEITQHLQASASDKFPLKSPFNVEWQSFVVRQFRLAFVVLVVCWCLSIVEAVVVVQKPREPNAIERISEQIEELIDVHEKIGKALPTATGK